MLNISGYQIDEQIHQSVRTMVFRGRRGKGTPVVIKVPQNPRPSAAELAGLRAEYDIGKSIEHRGVVRTLALERADHRLALVLEDFGGQPLARSMAGEALEVPRFLELALPLCEAVAELHRRDITHKDINPANIIHNPQSGEIKIADLSIASVLRREGLRRTTPQLLGTLRYMAPEQTGRVNRTIDYRADFYSLGATFYEMLTGQPPFATEDAAELLHSHIARTPESPSAINPKVPAALSAVVLKLLAKTPEDRYQSASGLLADLQRCRQMQDENADGEFVAGVGDVSARFQIPERIYGRRRERDQLRAALERAVDGSRQLLLLQGEPGIGKSSLAGEMLGHVARHRGWYASGKFDQAQEDTPHSAFIQAAGELLRLLLTGSEQSLGRWKQRLEQALGSEGRVLLDVLPGLELIIGPQPAVPELSPDEAEHRLHRLFCLLVRVLTDTGRPLVVFLNGLQWADGSSLRLTEALLADDQIHHLLLLGATLSADHDQLSLALESIRKGPAEVNILTLGPLEVGPIARLVADTTHRSMAEAHELAELVRAKTLGNPFFVTQFLQSLQAQELLTFDAQQGAWSWDLDKIRTSDLADNVVELLIQKMRALPPGTLRVLELAACIGDRFDLGTLCVLAEQSLADVVPALHAAVEEGIITTVCGGFNHLVRWDLSEMESVPDKMLGILCDFSHDRIHEAAHTRLAASEHHDIHLRLGRLMLQNLDAEALEERLFEVVNHLNIGRRWIPVDLERLEVARLNLRAGLKARAVAARATAERFFTAGMELLPEQHWETCHELSFELHHGMYTCRVLRPDQVEQTLALGEELLAHARTTTQRLRAVALHLMQVAIRGRDPARALKLGVDVLWEVGIDMDPPDPDRAIAEGYAELKQRLAGDRLDAVRELPQVTDEQILATMEVLHNLFFFPMYIRYREKAPLVALASARLSLEHGNGPSSGSAYATLGLVVAHTFGDARLGYRLGRLAAAVGDLQGTRRAMIRAIGTGSDWLGETPAETLARSRASIRLARETHEPFAAAIFSSSMMLAGLLAGEPLDTLQAEAEPLVTFIEQELGTSIGPREIHLTLRYVHALRGRRPYSSLFDDPEEAAAVEAIMAERNPEALQWYYLVRARLSYLLGTPNQALEMAERSAALADPRVGHQATYQLSFDRALILAAIHDEADEAQRPELRQQVHQCVDQLSKWSEAGIQGHLGHLQMLAAAEAARIDGDVEGATQAYRRAITRADELDLPQHQALSNELAARFYLSQGLEKVAGVFLRDAHYCYERWGALAKVEQLAERYPELRLEVPIQPASYTATDSTTTGSQAMDLATVIKASMAISGEVKLEALLQRLLDIVMENAGAERGFLVLPQDGELQIQATCTEPGKVQTVEPAPVGGSDQLAVGVVQYVARTSKEVVLSDAAAEGMFRSDPYVSHKGARSVLCLPLSKGGQQLGVLYLENNLTTGAFTAQRLEVVRLLCGQASIALENARLYAQLEASNLQLEQKVEVRTRDLAKKNEQLGQSLETQKEMQNQLIISEKMASLGNLVAGVAHEINTPMGAMVSSTDTSRRAIEKLQRALEKADSLEEVQRGRRVKKLFTLLWSNFEVMGTASGRVTRIVNTLRNFARLDEAERKQVDLHEGLNSTLSLVGHRLKGTVTVVKEYGDLEPVLCYPNQLNQVFMNLLVNAIDAVEADQGSITISTFMDAGQTHVRISDTGAGIPRDVLPHIFDPGFTTKGVGVGTGLGLSICFNIVQKHKGVLSVESEAGQGTSFTVSLPAGG